MCDLHVLFSYRIHMLIGFLEDTSCDFVVPHSFVCKGVIFAIELLCLVPIKFWTIKLV
jgi:hypothetical protein